MVCFGNNTQVKKRIHKTYPYQIKKIKIYTQIRGKHDSKLVKPYSLAGTYTGQVPVIRRYIPQGFLRIAGIFPSGTTWTEEIVWQIYNHGQIKTQLLREKVPYLDFAATIGESDPMIPDLNTMPSPRIMKTHLDYGAVPKGSNEDTKCKYIYVARNPKDVLVSGFSFKANMSPLNNFHASWEFYTKLFMEGNGKFVRPFHLQ